MSVSNLPTINAILNGISLIFLILGYIQIKKNNQATHQKFMISALISSAFFLVAYVIYHYSVGSVPYPYHDWTKPVYFIILIPHILFAAIMSPFILAAVYYAIKGNFIKHKKITRWLWPVWVFVSISGITIYLMLYR